MKSKLIFGALVVANMAAAGWIFSIRKNKNSGAPQYAYAGLAVIPSAVDPIKNGAKPAESAGLAGDGLRNPSGVETFRADDYGAGMTGRETFSLPREEIKITRERFETGTAHGYYQYKVERGGRDITPKDFRTVEGADCALQKIKFHFDPVFGAVKISRPWRDSWITPTMAVRTEYRIGGGGLEAVSETELRLVCDVSELF
ncbi:MAG: hypothetical protein LBB08_00845 [Rickettsiales bacterium]|jgi:hypothetical protein|nr:hypothetical protein [Rickettsiales bacterium]